MARVLIVDDVSVHRQKMKQILESEGHEVVGQATNGLQASIKYKNLKPDLVTMDILMQGNDGIDGIRRICKYDPKAKVLVVSSVSEKEIVMEALQCGAHAYVLKPFESDKVINTLENMGFVVSKNERENISEEMKKLKERNNNTDKQLENIFEK